MEAENLGLYGQRGHGTVAKVSSEGQRLQMELKYNGILWVLKIPFSGF